MLSLIGCQMVQLRRLLTRRIILLILSVMRIAVQRFVMLLQRRFSRSARVALEDSVQLTDLQVEHNKMKQIEILKLVISKCSLNFHTMKHDQLPVSVSTESFSFNFIIM